MLPTQLQCDEYALLMIERVYAPDSVLCLGHVTYT